MRFDFILIQTAQRAVGLPQIGKREWTLWVEGDRLPNEFHGAKVVPCLVGNDTEKMQCVGVVWLHGENLAVERLSFRQPPSLMVLEREIECLLDRHHRSTACAHQCRHMVR